jgi:hypothetical protein
MRARLRSWLACATIAACGAPARPPTPPAAQPTQPTQPAAQPTPPPAPPPVVAPAYADVDCERLMSHLAEVVIADAEQNKPDQVAEMKRQMAEGHAKFVAACEREKDQKKLTPKQYACVLASKSLTEMAGCMEPG